MILAVVIVFFLLMGLTLVGVAGGAIMLGFVRGTKDAWNYWAVRRKYKL